MGWDAYGLPPWYHTGAILRGLIFFLDLTFPMVAFFFFISFKGEGKIKRSAASCLSVCQWLVSSTNENLTSPFRIGHGYV